ncbi:MAG: hypothetical protein IJG50_04215 [Clostridia bacterium]|nr:hypothetical protein [Clostridia bacterium]
MDISDDMISRTPLAVDTTAKASKEEIMTRKKKLTSLYADKVKEKKSINEMCAIIEKELSGQQISIDLMEECRRKIFEFDLQGYKKSRGLRVSGADPAVIYAIPRTEASERYYRAGFTKEKLRGYEDSIIVILVPGLPYYLYSNCAALSLWLSLEYGVSTEDIKNKSDEYYIYLTNIGIYESGIFG